MRLFGSRVGIVSIRREDLVAVADYEVGASVDLIVYRRNMRTRNGTGLTGEQRARAIETLARWAAARGTSIRFAQD